MKNLLLIAFLLLIFLPVSAKEIVFFDKTVTIKELARQNQIAPSKLLHELANELELKEVSGISVVENIGLTKDQFIKLYLHMNDEITPLMILGMVLWVLIAFLIFYWIKKKKLTQNKRIVIFIISIVFFGIILHANPSPMESIVKLFKATAGKESWHLKIFIFSFFTIFSLLASNLFCSFGCQIGAIQDLIFQLFRKKKVKYRKLSFLITNGIRLILFFIFILFMYDVFSGLSRGSLYHDVNIFKVYTLGLGKIGVFTFVITILLSGVIYRPFCSIICPFGLWSWAISHLSFQKIKIDKEECIKCKKCVVVCPNNAMDNIYNKKIIKKDCYSCGECINNCPVNCIDFK